MSKKLSRPKASRRPMAKTKSSAASNAPVAAAAESTRDSANPEPSPSHAALQSIIPPTEEIDSDWGSEDEEDDGPGPVLVADVEPSKGAVVAAAKPAVQSAPTRAPKVEPATGRSGSQPSPTSASLAADAQRFASVEPKRSSTPTTGTVAAHASPLPPAVTTPTIPPTRRQTPAGGMQAVASDRAPRPSTPPRSLTPTGGVPSTRPPPPSSRIRNPAVGTAMGLSDVPSRPSAPPRSFSPAGGVAQVRPSTPPPRSATPTAGTPAVRQSQAPEGRVSSIPQSARTNPAPRPSSPRASTPAAGMLAVRSATPSRPSSAPRTLSPSAGIPATIPGTPAARLKPQAEGAIEPPKQVKQEATAIQDTQPEPKRVAVDVALPPAVLAEFLSPPPSAVSSQPHATMPAPKVVDVVHSTMPAVDSTALRPQRNSRFWLVLGVLWVITATVPALIVWQSMRHAGSFETAIKPEVVKREPAALPKPMVEEAAPKPSPVEPAPVADPKPAETAVAAAAVGEPATSAAVVVETDSVDRVSVLVKSRPTGAKVYRRSKEIGRTPLTIQIGRGEHRIFEVGWTNTGSKRISVDGEKPEITVNLVPESKP